MSGNRVIGFYKLLVNRENNDWMLGALLVTDDLGKPEEFRVTYPVRPTLIQRQLYGDSLATHVGVDLCGKPLYQALKCKPDLLVVSDAPFLIMSEDKDIQCPVVHLEKVGDALIVNNPVVGSDLYAQKIYSATGRFQPLSVNYPRSYVTEQLRTTATLVSDFFAGFDLLEPFNRIDIAIQTLKAQDEKFR